MEENEKEVIVYGSHCGEVTFFIPISVAQHYANLHVAHNKGISFAELFDKLPDFFYLIIGYRYYYFHGHGDYISPIEGLSCEEFYSNLLKELYHDVDHECDSFDEFCDFYQKLPIEERLPLSNDRFNETSIPSDLLIDIIDYKTLIHWVPDDIFTKFARTELSIHYEDITDFREEDEEEIVKAFERAGYRCVHNVKLIAQVHGSELPE
jgi:hypothetical protein